MFPINLPSKNRTIKKKQASVHFGCCYKLVWGGLLNNTTTTAAFLNFEAST